MTFALARIRCLRRRLIRVIPRILITDTFQVTTAVTLAVFGLISLGAVLSDSGLMSQTLASTSLKLVWSLSFTLGGVCQILGIQMSWERWERYGCYLASLASFAYALTLFAQFTWPSVGVGVIFTSHAIGTATHVFLSDAAQADRKDRE